MKKARIATVLGTRPEIIKLSLLIPLLDKEFDHKVVFTSQHFSRNMADIFFEEMGVRKPDRVLEVRSSDYGALEPEVGKALRELEPEYVLVYGDTNSTLSSAMAARKQGMKIIHVEAGLRSYDPEMPEERNRIETDRMSYCLFAPTELCRKQLAREGITKNVFVVGNPVVDACLFYSQKVAAKKGRYVLLTAHRQENVDSAAKLMELLNALSELKARIIFPMHPRTKARMKEFGLEAPKNVELIEPTGYLEFLSLLKGAELVLTDSGGVQEEAITLGVPCLTLRSGNERWEAVEAGGNFVVGTEPKLISSYARQIIDGDLGARMRKAKNPFGDGKASERIAEALKKLV